MERGAPIGNQNSTTEKRWWANTLRRALLQEDGKKLRQLADKLIARAEEGDIAALKEIGDRLDGKPSQTIAGDPDQPLIHKIERVIVGRTAP
jgi:hypothetical protein